MNATPIFSVNRRLRFLTILFAGLIVSTLTASAEGLSATKVTVIMGGSATSEGSSGTESYSASFGFFIPELMTGSEGGTGQPGQQFQTSACFVKLEPGRLYTITSGGSNISDSSVSATAPPGYAIELNGVECSSFSGGEFTIRLVPKYNAFSGRAGTASSLSTGKVHWQVALGSLPNGDSARCISLLQAATGTAANWDAEVFKLSNLSVQSSEVSVYRDGFGDLRQVMSREAWVDIKTLSGPVTPAYQLFVYNRLTADIDPATTSQPYHFLGKPYVVYTVSPATLPDGTKIPTSLKIVRDDMNPNGASIRTSETTLVRTGTDLTNFAWAVVDWHQTSAAPTVAPGTAGALVTEIDTASTSFASGLAMPSGERESTVVRKNEAGIVATKLVKHYKAFEWAEETTKTSLGDDNPIVEELAYHTWWGTGYPGPSYLRAKKSGGRWEAYDYESYVYGRLTRTFRPFGLYEGSSYGAEPPTQAQPAQWNAGAGSGEVTTLTYNGDVFDRVKTTVTTVNGIQSGKAETTYLDLPTLFNGEHIVAATRSDWPGSSTTALKTYTKFYQENTGNSFLRNQIVSVQHPDGSKESYAYQKGTFDVGTSTFVPTSGVDASRISIIRGTSVGGVGNATLSELKVGTSDTPVEIDSINLIVGQSTLETTIRDDNGRLARTELWVRASTAWQLLTWTNFSYDYANRLIGRTSSNGATYTACYTSSEPNQTIQTGLLQAEVDENGIRTEYSYDPLGRVAQAIKKGSVSADPDLITTFKYDAAGHVLEQVTKAATAAPGADPLPGQGETLQVRRTYDTAGRLVSEISPGVGQTTYSYDPENRTRTTTLPSGATRTETYLIDGRLASVTGSAVVAQHYTYGLEPLAPYPEHVFTTRVNLVSRDGERTQKSWRDQIGRPLKNRRPAFSPLGTDVEENFYYQGVIGAAPTGLLTKSEHSGYADTLYEYDTMGRLVRSGQRISGTGSTLVPASKDRFVETTTAFENSDSAWWLTTSSATYFTDNNATSKTVAQTRTRLTGFTGSRRSEIRTRDADGIIDDKDVITTVDVDPSAKTVTTTTKRPGFQTDAVSVSRNGLPISVRGHDNLESWVTYDALKRIWKNNDPRKGLGAVVTTYYQGTPLPASVQVAPGTDKAGLTTLYYDSSGRTTAIKDPADKITRMSYTPRGELWHQWGDAANPVEYAYTDYGERRSLTTYRGTSGWNLADWPSGATSDSVTTWYYDAPTGLLTAKEDAAHHTLDYTYNIRGQVADRKSPRHTPVSPPAGSGIPADTRITTTYGYDDKTGELLTVSYNDGTPNLTYTYTRSGRVDSVDQSTLPSALTAGLPQVGAGPLDFIYDSSAPWRLSTESWYSFYGSNFVVTHGYDNASATGTNPTVAGRLNGYQVGVSGDANTLKRDLDESYTFTAEGRLSTITSRPGSSSAATYTYSYTPNSSLVAGYTVGNFTQSIAYEPNRDLPTQVKTTWSGPAGATIAQYDYIYNKRGERESAKQSGRAFRDYGAPTYYRYGYSARGEVESAATYLGDTPEQDFAPQLSGRNFTYTYDSAGNRLTGSRTGPPAANAEDASEVYTPNNLNQYTTKENNALTVSGTANEQAAVTVTGGALPAEASRQGAYWGAQVFLPNNSGPNKSTLTITAGLGGNSTAQTRNAFLPPALQTFQYNPDGTLQSDGIWTYTWDAENRLVRMDSNPGGGYPSRTLEFKYDYLGRRIQKRSVSSAGDVYTRYLYDGWNVIAEYAATATTCGALSRSFTWGLDVTGSSGAAGGVGALIQITDHADGNKVYYPARDANGNIAALIAASATTAGAEPIAAAYEYSPFGELLRAEGPYAQKNPFRFSSKFTDDESGFVYYGHRYYSPTLGRFLCPDPLQEEGGTNLYAFCGNDGVNKWDFLGLYKPDAGNKKPSPEPDPEPTYWDNWVPIDVDYSSTGGYLSTLLIRDENRDQVYNPNSSRGRLRRVTDNPAGANSEDNYDAWYNRAGRTVGGFVIGAVEAMRGTPASDPESSDEYNGRVAGRESIKLLSVALMARGAANMTIGGGTVVAAATSELATAGASTPFSGPAAAIGARQFVVGALQETGGLILYANASNLGPLHHIATDKNSVSPARGGPWTPRFKKIFDKAGMDLQDALNKINVPGHRGPHPEKYHQAVFDRLTSATNGLNGPAYRNALETELRAIGKDAATPGNPLNRLLTGR